MVEWLFDLLRILLQLMFLSERAVCGVLAVFLWMIISVKGLHADRKVWHGLALLFAQQLFDPSDPSWP